LFEPGTIWCVIETALRGIYDKAVEDFEKALDIQPGSRKTVLAYGEGLRRARRPQKAAKVYAKWLDSDPNDAEMRSRYGQVLREAGDLDESLDQARRLLPWAAKTSRKPSLLITPWALPTIKWGKLDLAETALKKAADLDAKSAFVWNNLGLGRVRSRPRSGGLPGLPKGVGAGSEYMQARLNKAVVYLDCGDYKHARTELEEAVKIDPNDAEAQVALGVAARGDGKLDEARRSYERALDIDPDDSAALFNLGVLYMDFDKDKVKAKDYLTRSRRRAMPRRQTPGAQARLKNCNEAAHGVRPGAGRWAPSWRRAHDAAAKPGQRARARPPASGRVARWPSAPHRRQTAPDRAAAAARATAPTARPSWARAARSSRARPHVRRQWDVEGKLKTPSCCTSSNRVKLELEHVGAGQNARS